ncbi:MAG: hypothetical protein DWC03_02330 [Candidatus Poseidoniales archaeon]|nr:MAG: hypothetical protein DWC03_02330 [Candidatus Poseidoniales archaeon]
MSSEATEIGTGVLDQVVAGGLLYAVPLFIISLLLFMEGSKRIPMTVGIVGFIVGFGLVGELYEFVGENPPISEAQFRFIAAAAVGVISVSVAQMAMRFLAAGMVFLIITNLIRAGDGVNVDFEGDAFLSGILTLIAFFLSMSFRRLVPALMAGLVGTLGMMLAVYVAVGWDVGRLDGVSAPDAYLGLVGMLLSAFIQWRAIKQKENEEEHQKEYDFDF